ncbi:20500_t:CDS:2 [Rhizophagus irregularis]|nr:20500_t:CDS:2 [Rhizophagus irregularis]
MELNTEIDLDNLNLECFYTSKEFEYINNQLKNNILKINGHPVNLFELDKNRKLIPMLQIPYCKEQVVAEIAAQLRNWNIQTRQGVEVTISQVLQLTNEQAWSFQSALFTPIFLVEVADIGVDTDNPKFREVDKRFKEKLITQSMVVQLGWLIDPQHKQIYIYRKGRRCSNPGWKDISGENILPGFVLDISLINRIIDPILPAPSRLSQVQANCPYCNNAFNNIYELIKHLESVHC